MTGLDCNILVQLAFADHPAHSRTVLVVQTEIQQGRKLVFPALIATEFLHVVTDRRRFDPPLTMVEGMEWFEGFLANQAVSLLSANETCLDKHCVGCGSIIWDANEFSIHT